MNDETEYWRRVIEELQALGVTLERIAEHLGVSARQVSYWKRGQRPTGILAIKLSLFHEKHRSTLPGSNLHSAPAE